MGKSKRGIRYESDPTEEKVEQVIQKYERAVPARFTALWGDTRAEVVSAIPLAPPVGYVKQPSLSERIRAMVRSEHLRAAAEDAGYETFEEAEDFDVDDDPELKSPYEVHDEPLGAFPERPATPVQDPPKKPPLTPENAKAPRSKSGGAGGNPPAEAAEGGESGAD